MQDGNMGKRIKERREELNLSASDLAERLGMSKATIHRYENGEIKNIKPPVVFAISHELKVSAAWLAGKTDLKQQYEYNELAGRYKEITNVMNDFIVYLKFGRDLTMYGKHLSEGDRNSMAFILEMLIELASRKYEDKEK